MTADECVGLYARSGDDASADTLPSEVEVILTGDYATRKLQVTSARMEEMVKNHLAARVDPAIDREHESWGGGLFSGPVPSPAQGWIKALRVEPSKLDARRQALVATVEWTDLGEQAVKSKHFRYLSAGIDTKGKHRQSGADIGWVLDHLALVKNPFVQGMQPLSLSAHDQPKEKRMSDELRTLLGLSADADETAVAGRVKQLAAEAQAGQALKAEVDKSVEALKAAESARAEALSAGEKLAQRVTALEHEKLSAEVDKAVADFRITPAERDPYLALAKSNADTFRQLVALRQPQKPAEGKALSDAPRFAGGDRTKIQLSAIQDYMTKHPGTDHAMALRAVAAEQPALFEEA